MPYGGALESADLFWNGFCGAANYSAQARKSQICNHLIDSESPDLLRFAGDMGKEFNTQS